MKDDEGNYIQPNQKGYVYPFDFDGGYDSHGYKHNGFVCSSVKAASLYAAKYCCKDLAWYELLGATEFHKNCIEYLNEIGEPEYCYLDDDEKDYSNPLVFRPVLPYESVIIREFKLSRYKPFHYQSKSLGSSWLEGKTEFELMDALRNGVAFSADDKLQGLPVYLKNKILFNPKYVYEENPHTHEVRRLVRRECTQFFRENLSEIFALKVNTLSEKMQVMLSEEFYVSHGVSKMELEEFRSLSLRYESPCDVATLYLAYYGVPLHECLCVSPSIQWFRRYDDTLYDCDGCLLVDESWHSRIQYELTFLFNLYAKFEKVDDDVEKRNNREINRIHDLWLSQT